MGMRPTYWVGAFFGEGKGYILMETYTKTATIIFVKKKIAKHMSARNQLTFIMKNNNKATLISHKN